MEILGNMQVLSLLIRVLTSLRYQNRYCRCGESQRYHYGRCAVLKLVFVAPKFRLRRVQKKGKKEKKMKNRVLQKIFFYFSLFTSWKQFWGLIRVEKMVWRRCARQKNFLTFCRQIRCEILEISSSVSSINSWPKDLLCVIRFSSKYGPNIIKV